MTQCWGMHVTDLVISSSVQEVYIECRVSHLEIFGVQIFNCRLVGRLQNKMCYDSNDIGGKL